ncbi:MULTISPECIES: F0F1 ATP synthase subunit epsilon [Actinomycetaceae]|jgi:ATP synthase F1, epsilon subunit|uniref:F0F1 ATP synthase subunit epsilon n=1 Tax=Actinomycetaceae TaxID=2049 RepID=UPI0003977466|nr:MULTISPECIES: F0F1 ATP synthase subunit epsilon [Actinomycetaceae]ERH33272.1 ATP synthase, delta/epsilon subunit, beta-sandwich domain protein [Actinomyces sp. oral taxon 172 str. F0311]WLD78856.1 F0F1 ATP synthase subunit epsilon [Schaalia sp. HMT-172]
MASGKSLQVEVVSHEGRLWHGAALSVQIPTVDGSLGILPGRQPLLAQLGGGTVTVTCSGEVVSFEVSGGFASIDSDFVTLVADSATVTTQ